MSNQQFVKKYGKIKILNHIQKRNPVYGVKTKDPNRKLMIKFKYGNLNSKQEFEFHQSIKKMIYKVMHSNNVIMDWQDVYQQIWKKIIKSKHTWNESKGTMVSTWITIVANSVINTLRQVVNRYKTRNLLYEDIYSSAQEEGDISSSQQKYDLLSYIQDQNITMNVDLQRSLWKQMYDQFYNSLDEKQKIVFDEMKKMQQYFIKSYSKNTKAPYNKLKSRLGLDENSFNLIFYNLLKKYNKMFQKNLTLNSSQGFVSQDTEYIF